MVLALRLGSDDIWQEAEERDAPDTVAAAFGAMSLLACGSKSDELNLDRAR